MFALTAAAGETFEAIVCVTNEGSTPVSGVQVSAELHLDAAVMRTVSLGKEPDSPQTLAPSATLNLVVRRDVSTVGTHVLTCKVRSDWATEHGAQEHVFAKCVYCAASNL